VIDLKNYDIMKFLPSLQTSKNYAKV